MTKTSNTPEIEQGLDLEEMTPRQVVGELNRYIVGQAKAKRALALAARDRIRRQRLDPELAREIHPRNIILIGATGVGKTELARRLARLSRAPFLKVEASKFTEVGYVGRDVESIARDLVETAVDMVRQELLAQVEEKAEQNAEERLLEILATTKKKGRKRKATGPSEGKAPHRPRRVKEEVRNQLRKDLRDGKLNNHTVEIEVQERLYPSVEILSAQEFEESDLQFRDFVASMMGSRSFRREMKVEEAIDYLIAEEESRLVDMDQVAREALERAEKSGIVFIDELDKVAGRESGHGPDVSREGVQRDILPVIEGTSVHTRFGTIQTHQILFVAAGAFHVSRPSDLIPELQGRFPVRVEMDSLTEEDFVTILQKPKHSLVKQYSALLETEGVTLDFTDDAIGEIAHFAWLVNQTTEDIGARRLHTVMEALLDDVSFDSPELSDQRVVIDGQFVRNQLADIVKDSDLSRYIL
jgi:ATP-dependent HslUV protease ATP-binding subunit HslU